MNFDPKKHLPKVGPSGSPVVDFSLTKETGDERTHRMFAPRRPEREVKLYDDEDEWRGTRTLSEDEYAAALKGYEEASARHWAMKPADFVRKQVRGLAGFSPPVPDRIEIWVKCADGSAAEASWRGDRWHWTSETLHSGAVSR